MSEEALNAPRLAAAMRGHGLPVLGDMQISPIGLGRSNLTYLLTDAAGRRWVARRPPLGPLLASAHNVERETGILSALGRTDVPVPDIHCLLAAGEAAGVPVVVMEFVDGQVVDGFDGLRRLPVGVRTALVTDLARVLTTIHQVDLTAVGLDDLASQGPYAARQLRRWSRQWENSRTHERPALDTLTDLLRRYAPDPGACSLIHGDLSPNNLVVDPDHGTIRAVLDWELSTLGEPLADLGTVLAYWTVADAKLGLVGTAPVAEREELTRRYLTATGLAEGDVAYWHALGIWKLAIITEGIRRRVLDQPMNAAATGLPASADVDRLVELAREVADAAGLA